MNKKFAIAAALVSMAVAAVYAKFVMSEVAIMALHPELDEKIVIKAHRTMVRRSFAGVYNDTDIDNDEQWNQTFLAIVAELQK